MSSQPTISIVGAGISGLILARCLAKRGLGGAVTVYEKDSHRQCTATRHGYGISLQRAAYKPLLEILGVDEASFRRKVAVDAAVGGTGRIALQGQRDDARDDSFRANRRQLELMLQEGLQIRWQHSLEGIKPIRGEGAAGHDAVELTFNNGETTRSDLVIAADGPHSQVRRLLIPSAELEVLPYTVYDGKRRIDRGTFDTTFAGRMKDDNVVEHRIGNTLLQISVNEYADDYVSINFTYSRPAHDGADPLFNPARSTSGSQSIPDELFDEIGSLRTLEHPFKDVFNADAMRSDRLLHWLMRAILVPEADLAAAAAQQGVVFVGDAAHHGPILGSWGAKEAIHDAMALADIIADSSGSSASLADFYKSRYGRWVQYVDDGKARLAAMHGQRARSQL